MVNAIVKAIDAYQRGEYWFEIGSKYGYVMDELAKMTYKRVIDSSLFISPEAKDQFTNTGELKVPDELKDTVVHDVISHSFMEFLGISGLTDYIGAGRLKDEEDRSTYYKALRKIYDKFAEVNKIPEDLKELGWKEYLED